MSVYAADKDGNPVGEALTETVAAGNYVTVIEAVAGEYKGGKVLLPYTIKPASLGTLTVFEGDDVTDTTFVYTGKPLELGVASDNKALVAGKDYEVTFKNAADNKAGDVVNAGTYYAEVKGLGAYAGEKATILSSPSSDSTSPMQLSPLTTLLSATRFLCIRPALSSMAPPRPLSGDPHPRPGQGLP